MSLDDHSLITPGISRRDFLRVSGGAAAALAVFSVPGLVRADMPAVRAAGPISLEECMALTPLAMAERSGLVKNSFDYLVRTAGLIADSKIRRSVLEILQNPAPTIMALYTETGERESVRARLIAAGYIKPDVAVDTLLPPCRNPEQAPQPFYSAPGSGYMSHHSYPGGLATHVAVNVKASLGFYEAYADVYGYHLNKDIVIAAQTLHDLNKPWVFQWREDASSLPEQTIAGTGAHHILSIAEAVYRDLPAELTVAMACAHNHPGTPEDEAQVVNWIKAACILADKDPEVIGMLAQGGETLPLPRRQEGFITHLGDHDFVLTVPAAKWLIGKLKEMAKSAYGMTEADLNNKKFNSFRNYVFSQVSIKRLHQIWSTGGEQALLEAVKSAVVR
ncbi:MAG: twin-arginine translocation signal domain-containing protein [Negativicutes bacterium]|nr:twin-arginine translocation signal domain-containing protein [Negativicutes bacterium]